MSEQKEFERSLENATLKMIQDMASNMELACLVIERDAKKNTTKNVDSGALRASISHDVTFNTDMITGSVFSNLDYAPYLEKGTGAYAVDGNGRNSPWYVPEDVVKKSKKKPTFEGKVKIVYGKNKKRYFKTNGMKPHPFLEPARDSNKDKVSEILAGKNK